LSLDIVFSAKLKLKYVVFKSIINKTFISAKKYGKIVDAAVFENFPSPSLSRIVIKRGKKKITVPPNALEIHTKGSILKTEDFPVLPFDERDFYLNEDLLDKQVIDIDGKRLVRVNDILLEKMGR